MPLLSKPVLPRVLAITVFRQFLTALWLSNMANWAAQFLIGWLAWDMTHSPLWVGITSACSLTPVFLLSPIFGVVADRINTCKGLQITQLIRGLIVIAGAAAMAYGIFSLPWLLLMATVFGVITAAYHALRLPLINSLVPTDLLPNAIGLSSITFNISRIIGPALAGWAAVQGSTALAFLLSALLFFESYRWLRRMNYQVEIAPQKSARILEQLLEGMRHSFRHPVIRLILLLTLVNALMGRTVIEMLPALSGKLLQGNATTLASLTAAAGIGSIIGGILLTKYRDNRKKLMNMVLFTMLTSTLVTLPVQRMLEFWMVAGMVCYVSLAVTMAGVGTQSLTQLTVSEEYRGRVMSLWSVLSIGLPAIGAFVLGAIAEGFGFSQSLLGFSLTALVSILLITPSARRLTCQQIV